MQRHERSATACQHHRSLPRYVAARSASAPESPRAPPAAARGSPPAPPPLRRLRGALPAGAGIRAARRAALRAASKRQRRQHHVTVCAALRNELPPRSERCGKYGSVQLHPRCCPCATFTVHSLPGRRVFAASNSVIVQQRCLLAAAHLPAPQLQRSPLTLRLWNQAAPPGHPRAALPRQSGLTRAEMRQRHATAASWTGTRPRLLAHLRGNGMHDISIVTVAFRYEYQH